MNALTLDALGLQPDDEALEIGFGGGALLEAMLARTRGRVTGVDISEVAVERARRRLGANEWLRLAQASVENLPVADASIDAACSVNNIYFWPDPAAGFRELARVIRPGGRLVIAFEPPAELAKWPGHRFGFRLFAEDNLRRLMDDAGFTMTSRLEGRGRKPDFFLCLTGERRGGEETA